LTNTITSTKKSAQRALDVNDASLSSIKEANSSLKFLIQKLAAEKIALEASVSSAESSVKDVVSTSEIQTLVEVIKPNLKNNDYGAAIEYSIIFIDQLLSQSKINGRGAIVSMFGGNKGIVKIVPLIIGAGYGIFFGMLLNTRHRKKLNVLKEGQVVIDKLLDGMDNINKFSSTCPSCLKDFSSHECAFIGPLNAKSIRDGSFVLFNNVTASPAVSEVPIQPVG
jgi:hypothetical protein